MRAKAAIRFSGVSFAYGSTPVLEDVDLTIGAQQMVCLVGPNGGGKTTLLRLALGFIEPRRGRVEVCGLPPVRGRRRIGYMPQHIDFDAHFPITVREVVAMGRLDGARPGFMSRRDRAVVDEVLDEVDLGGCARAPFGSLSGGQRQRALIARALAVEPEILFLDEPTAMVDARSEARLLAKLRELHSRLTIVMVSHDAAFVANLVETVVCVNRRVSVHPAHEISHGMIHELYGDSMKAVLHDHDAGDGSGNCHG